MKLWDKIYWVVKMFGPLDASEVYENVCKYYQESGTMTHLEVHEELEALIESGAIIWNYTHDNNVRVERVTTKYRKTEPLF